MIVLVIPRIDQLELFGLLHVFEIWLGDLDSNQD